jgi:hypothetical protein
MDKMVYFGGGIGTVVSAAVVGCMGLLPEYTEPEFLV